mmetsp:Transcript_64919/g.130521  ORF Transcript_64919/g.130521 Transcript_64919/m.130521 type:complete len:488 (-) Transcript_64919:71-1534(-)
MIGGDSDDDDDSGEEEILEESSTCTIPVAAAVEESVNLFSKSVTIGSVAIAQAAPLSEDTEPLTEAPLGWTTHQSKSYRNRRFPGGYVYYYNSATGDRRWAVPAAGVKRNREDISLGGLYYASPPTVISGAEVQRLVLESDGHIKLTGEGVELKVEYFCDQAKKWAFQTDQLGLVQLCHLVRTNREPLALCNRLIGEAERGGGADVRREGRDIYREKKHLINSVAGAEKVTWSQDEYAHPGMQLVYLSLKSWQRFTETWALLERAHNLGLFEPHNPTNGGALAQRPVRVLSIGGGPGYELVAFERFFRRLPGCSQTPVQLVSLDLMPGWRPFVETMGMQFGTYDIKGPHSLLDVVAALNADEGKGPFPDHGVTYVLISYVMIYVSTPEVCDMLKALLEAPRSGKQGVRAILVSERGEETKPLGMMEKRGTQVARLIDQSNGVDERQSMWLSSSTLLTPPKPSLKTSFPNVPFEDGKQRKNMKKTYHG